MLTFVGFDQRLAGRDRGWFLYGPDTRLQHDIAGTLGNGAWGYIVGTAGPGNQRLYLNGARVAQMSVPFAGPFSAARDDAMVRNGAPTLGML